MLVIPAINCIDAKCVRERFKTLESFNVEWVHIDVSDGQFTSALSWNVPADLPKIFEHISHYKIEVHLMVAEPESMAMDWLNIGAKRLIVHIESHFNLKQLHNICRSYGAELMLALKPETSLENLGNFDKKLFSGVQFLAVSPGYSGQKFQKNVLEKVKTFRVTDKRKKVEVDGGINKETALLVKEIGADIIVSGSYIFKSPVPKLAYESLTNL